MSLDPLDCVLRAYTERDRPFVVDSYLKHFRRGHPMRLVPASLYFRPQERLFDLLLARSTCLVSCFPDDPTELTGWVMYEPGDHCHLHYLYVYSPCRKRGIGRKLFSAATEGSKLVVATHACDAFITLRHKAQPARMVYDPFHLYRIQRVA